MDNIKIWDPIVRDLLRYERTNSWEFLEYYLVNRIDTQNWVITTINWYIVESFRKPTQEELERYFNINK